MGTIVQINTSRGGLPKRAVPGGFLSEAGLEGMAVERFTPSRTGWPVLTDLVDVS